MSMSLIIRLIAQQVQQQPTQQHAVATATAAAPPLPTMRAMLAQLQVELELGGDATLAQVESAAAAFGYAPDPNLTRCGSLQRTAALWNYVFVG
jgi:hypothetical protein